MEVKIKRIDKSLPLPEYQTKGSVAFDLYSRIDMEIKPKEIALIPTNLIIQTPPNYMLAVVPRSSTPKKLGLFVPHGIGIIDQDYCGPEDEIHLQVFNFTDNSVNITRGQRIGQAVFVRIDTASWQEIDQIETKTRGGFGSTG
ncbi:MAG: dUTP diphosphatase [Candidatus Parcubacteria bacterium]|nr:dUTP diphosphatase [Candidatus Parcubacteria bacterium]